MVTLLLDLLVNWIIRVFIFFASLLKMDNFKHYGPIQKACFLLTLALLVVLLYFVYSDNTNETYVLTAGLGAGAAMLGLLYASLSGDSSTGQYKGLGYDDEDDYGGGALKKAKKKVKKAKLAKKNTKRAAKGKPPLAKLPKKKKKKAAK